MDLLLCAELMDDTLAPWVGDLLGCAATLGEHDSLAAEGLVIGPAPEDAARILAAEGVPVRAVDLAGNHVTTEVLGRVLEGLCEEHPVRYVLLGHTALGLGVAPWLAARCGAACVTGVERVDVGPEGVLLSRRIMGGALVERVQSSAALTVVTVRPGCFGRERPEAVASGRVHWQTAQTGPLRVEWLAQESAATDDAGLKEAEVIVAAGRGLGDPENLALVEQVAALFPGAAVAGSRPVCDQGWLAPGRQVGQTGATVCPRLYLACGISGAPQHIDGMRGSEFVVAINRDPQAAIFEVADLAVVEDLQVFLPAFVAAARKKAPPGRA